jgi:hypothetical protein
MASAALRRAKIGIRESQVDIAMCWSRPMMGVGFLPSSITEKARGVKLSEQRNFITATVRVSLYTS